MKFSRLIIATAFLSTTLFPTAFAAEDSFTDTADHPYVKSIDYVRSKGIVDGYDDGTYKPNQQINRAEFTKIIISAKFDINAIDLCLKGREESDQEMFTDVNDQKWFSKYVCVAKEKGIINGYDDGSFKPGESINFVEAAKILVNTFDITAGEKGDIWYHSFVLGLQDQNYIPPSVSSLDKKINRAEMAELIFRILEKNTQQSSKTLIETEKKTETAGTEEKEDETDSKDIIEDEKNGDSQTIAGGAGETRKFIKPDYEFNYPASWHFGTKAGKDYLSEEKEYIDNLELSGYLEVKTYVLTYTVPVSSTLTSNEEALQVANRFEHPEVESKELEINGVKALRRHFRAEEGDTVNGRETQVAENIFQYTFLDGDKVHVLQYFIAYTREDYNLDLFEAMAKSFKLTAQSN